MFRKSCSSKSRWWLQRSFESIAAIRRWYASSLCRSGMTPAQSPARLDPRCAGRHAGFDLQPSRAQSPARPDPRWPGAARLVSRRARRPGPSALRLRAHVYCEYPSRPRRRLWARRTGYRGVRPGVLQTEQSPQLKQRALRPASHVGSSAAAPEARGVWPAGES